MDDGHKASEAMQDHLLSNVLLMRAATAHVSSAVAIVDDHWRICAVSHAFCLFVNQSCAAVLTASLLKIESELFGALLLAPRDAEWMVPVYISEVHHVIVHTQPLSEKNTFIGWIVTLQDIRDRQTPVQPSYTCTDHLIQRLHQKVDGLRGWSPVPAQQGNDASWKEQLDGDIQQLSSILGSCHDRLTLLDQIEHSSATVFTPANPATIIDERVSMYREALDRYAISVDMRLVDVEIPISVPMITQAVCELLDNAINFTHNNGCICITMDCQHDYVAIKVCDTGCGIPQQSFDAIFEPFCYLERPFYRSANGCGLGLAIVKAAVQKHGGFIELNSVIGHSTCFTILLPSSWQVMDENQVAAMPGVLNEPHHDLLPEPLPEFMVFE